MREFPRQSSTPHPNPLETGQEPGVSNFDQNSEGIAKGEKVVIDLTGLVEEVIQVVVAGYGFKPTNFETLNKEANEVHWKMLSRDPSNGSLKRTLTLNKDIVPIVLDIEERGSWLYRTQSAAFRRILMNLLGNALKYTNRGFVHVKLSIQQPNQLTQLNEGNGAVDLVTLTVEDTGKGMKQEFLSEGLFAAFSQEDHLSPGTGLGMAIVNLLVKSLGGTITVQSRLGEGTKFTVTLPLQCGNLEEVRSTPGLVITPKISTFDETRAKTIGKRVSMLGFHPPSGDKLQLRKLEVMSKSLRGYLVNWFGMTIVPYTNRWRTESDLLVLRYSAETSKIVQTLAGNNPVLVLHADSSKIISSTSAWVKSLSTP